MKTDRNRWEAKYAADRDEFPPPDPFLVHYAHLLIPGRALYPACGLGANALFLAEQGYEVDATDVSFAALSRLQDEAARRGLHVRTFVADLDYYPFPQGRYDLALVFYFFSPALIPSIKATLKCGGMIVYSTYNYRHTSVKPGFNPDYLTPPGGLSSCFSDFDILVSEPEAGEHGNLSRLIGRKRNT